MTQAKNAPLLEVDDLHITQDGTSAHIQVGDTEIVIDNFDASKIDSR